MELLIKIDALINDGRLSYNDLTRNEKVGILETFLEEKKVKLSDMIDNNDLAIKVGDSLNEIIDTYLLKIEKKFKGEVDYIFTSQVDELMSGCDASYEDEQNWSGYEMRG